MLNQYRAKRSFDETPEPRGKKKNARGQPIFVVQKHDATRLHYDFRLEYKGVLLSWAIPKGPSLDPSDKRLAIQVEDHPFDYHDFEGIIPKGQYGAGTVMVWDEGTYSVPGIESKKSIEEAMTAGLKKGHLQFILQGKKLNGLFHLVRLKRQDSKPQWLLFKSHDEEASKENIVQKAYSVKTGRSLDEIAEGEEKRKKKSPRKKVTLPGFIKPMLATLSNAPFSDPEWLFEMKWDGFRALAYVNDTVTLYSRNRNVFNALFPVLVEDLRKTEVAAVLDGEIMVLDPQGRPRFQMLQNYQNRGGDLIYYVFDLLYLEGKDVRNLPLIQRKEMLAKLINRSGFSHVRLSEHIVGEGEAFFKQIQKHHLEGMIAKRSDSMYHSVRSKQWLKMKAQQGQEVLIGGFTQPQGGRKKFGSLLLGVYNKKKEFVYVGHVGTGFNAQKLNAIYEKMQPLLREECPFSKKPRSKTHASWVLPKLLCEVTFSEWTQEGTMRHPVFQGLRDDKQPRQVIKEEPMVYSEITLSNPDKIYFPKLKLTKRDVWEYYKQVAPYLLPYLKDRPLVLRRFPEGIEGESFVQKNTANLHVPDYMKTIEIAHEEKNVTYFVIQNIPSLEYVVNLGSIEMHTFHATMEHLDFPDYCILDLDPVEVSFDTVIGVAQTIHHMFDEMKIPHYCKTSGGRGLHIYIPLGAKYQENQVAHFGDLLAVMIHERLPKITSLERRPVKRQKKVYIDVLQNRTGQTVATPYSLRGKPHAPVSTPLHWDEVVKGIRPEMFNLSNTLKRLDKVGDLFKPVLRKGFDIKKWLKTFNT